MRFGKPKATAEPAPEEAREEEVEIALVQVNLRSTWEWTWTLEGENRKETARALFDKLTGAADEHGWIRDNDGDWAYRPDQIIGVHLRYEKKR